jgi:RNA polymerase primary sigma factor
MTDIDPWKDDVTSPEETADRAIRRTAIRRAVQALPELERQVIELRWGFDRRWSSDPRTLAQTAEILNLSVFRVRQLESYGLTRLSALRDLVDLAGE